MESHSVLRQMTMRRTRLFLILGLIALLPAVGALGQNQRVLVVRGGLLIDGTGADPVPNSVVVIANGKIQSVGRDPESRWKCCLAHISNTPDDRGYQIVHMYAVAHNGQPSISGNTNESSESAK